MNAETLKSIVGEMSINFKDDKNFEMTALNNTGEGTYTVSGEKLVLTIQGQEQEATLKGSEITLAQSGVNIIFKKN